MLEEIYLKKIKYSKNVPWSVFLLQNCPLGTIVFISSGKPLRNFICKCLCRPLMTCIFQRKLSLWIRPGCQNYLSGKPIRKKSPHPEGRVVDAPRGSYLAPRDYLCYDKGQSLYMYAPSRSFLVCWCFLGPNLLFINVWMIACIMLFLYYFPCFLIGAN